MKKIMTETEFIIKPPEKLTLNWQELWQYRELFYFFTWRDIKVKYKQTALGFLWVILQPLLMMGVFVLFFSKGLKISTDNIPAPVFYLSGLIYWNLFSAGLSNSANSMVTNAQIIKKIYFPRLIIPISSILVATFDFTIALIIVILLLLGYLFLDSNMPISVWTPFFFLAALVLTVITTFGLGSLLAALNVQYRDFRYVIPFMIQFMLFITPVFYPLTLFESIPYLKYFLALNPITGAILLARSSFLNIPVDWILISISSCSAIVLLLLGLYTFRKMEAYFADIA